LVCCMYWQHQLSHFHGAPPSIACCRKREVSLLYSKWSKTSGRSRLQQDALQAVGLCQQSLCEHSANYHQFEIPQVKVQTEDNEGILG
jgi:hypothetical protein